MKVMHNPNSNLWKFTRSYKFGLEALFFWIWRSVIFMLEEVFFWRLRFFMCLSWSLVHLVARGSIYLKILWYILIDNLYFQIAIYLDSRYSSIAADTLQYWYTDCVTIRHLSMWGSSDATESVILVHRDGRGMVEGRQGVVEGGRGR